MKIKLKGQYASREAAESLALTDSPSVSVNAGSSNRAENGRRQQRQRSDPSQSADGDAAEEAEADDNGNGEDAGEAAYQASSTSSSQGDDDDFLNAPIRDLPESSGDEYSAPSGKPRGRPLGSRNRSSASFSASRPIRASRSSFSLADDSATDDAAESSRQARSIASPRRAAMSHSAGLASGTAPPLKRGRGRPPGSLNKKTKLKQRSETPVLDEEEENSEEDEDPEDSAMFDDDEGNNSAFASGRSTPSGRAVYGADGKRRGGAVSGARTKAVKGAKYDLANDELALPIDPKGEEKVDHLGRLLGGREYKTFTFTSPARPEPERRYVLAIDAARCAGFRDSLYFFRRNPWIHKVNASQEEKELLIELGRLHQNLRSRQVTIVTARSLYRVFGARFIKNGKHVTDDYYEAAAIAKGYKAGTPAHSEIYDPDIDNTTLAMPKIGSFAKSKAEGRPAYMRMEKAFELLHRGRSGQDQDDDDTPDVDNYAEHEEREAERRRKRKEDDGESSHDEQGNITRKGRKRPSAFVSLALPQNYAANTFGLIATAFSNQAPAAQFGGNGQPPFGEQWERSKAKKPAPFLTGFNWMYEFARFTSRETNRAIMGVRREYNAYHRITLGLPQQSLTPLEAEEEQEGVWDISESDHEDEYETLDQYHSREGLDSGAVIGPDGEMDDRKRGRSPSPSQMEASENQANNKVKSADSDADVDMGGTVKKTQTSPKRKRRRRSPLRGYYDSHTRIPQIKQSTQASQVLSWEQTDLQPHVSLPDQVTAPAMGMAQKGIATVQYCMKAPAQ